MGSNDLYEPFFCDKEWEEYILFNLAKWENGFPFRKKDFSQEGIPIIKISELKNGITTNTNFTDKYFDEKYFLKRNDLLFSWSGSPETSIDVFWFKLKNGWLNQHIFKVYPREQIVDKKFLYYLLKYLKPNLIQIAKNKQTTGLGHVTIEDLKKIKVKLPYLSEQQKIASILSAFDDKIHLNNEMNKTLEEIAQVIFKQWFIDFEFPNENGEPYKSSGGEFVDSELGPIPRGWEVKKLGEIGQFKNGINYGREESGDSEYKIVNVRDLVTTDYIIPSRLDTININKRKANQYLLKEGDLLIVRSANPGEIGININGDSNLIYSSFIIRFRLYDKLQLFYLYFSLKNLKQKLEIYSNGTTLKNINQQILKEVKVVIPTKNILQKFNVIIYPIIEKIIASNEQNDKLAKIRDTLLPKLISGEIRVM